ncbi:hypothetical protein P3T21_002295 [Paraburkholderia sp. GAS334]
MCGGRLPSLNVGECRLNTPVAKAQEKQASAGNGGDLPPSTADIVRIGVGVVFHLDVLKMAPQTQIVSVETHRANTTDQMLLDLEDLQ